jgi:hypothetical protein
VAEGIIIKEEDENDVTTDSGVDSLERFDPNKDKSDFEDKDIEDENM